jgi:glycosyltransferase involved in cell wall biosynthesis
LTTAVRVLEVLGRSAGGIARHVAQVVDSLDGSDGLAIDIAAPPDLPVSFPKDPILLEIPDGIRGHRRTARDLAGLVTQGGYDVIHAHGLRAAIDAGMAARKTGARVISTVHNLVRSDVAGPAKALLQRPAEPLAVRASERVLAVSEEIAGHLRRVASRHAERIEVLHLGIGQPPEPVRSRTDVRTSLGVGADEPLIVTVARLSPQKALEVLLNALARIPDNSTLVILGEGPLETELKAHARELGIDRRVRFLGFRDDVVDLIAAADVFALSSTWEGVPLAAQEAISLGVPVVSTDVGGMSELITDGTSGHLVPRGDDIALAAALTAVIGDPERARLMAGTAQADLHRNFSTAHMLIRLTQLYRSDADAQS